MTVKLSILLLLLLIDTSAQSVPKFMGREITIVDPGQKEDGFEPKGPASVCLEGPPERQCYTTPQGYGNNPTVAVVQLQKDVPTLLFSAQSGGVSGFLIQFALLRPGAGKDLQNFFFPDMSVSNQSQHAFWSNPAISQAQIFVTADFVWGPDESHYEPHRYIISAYTIFENRYYLEDRYMTARKYDLDANADILNSEKQEILARLRRIKAGSKR